MNVTTFVVGEPRLAGRTLRALSAAGLEPEVLRDEQELRAALASRSGPVWLLRAGAFPVRGGPIEFPRPSGTGLPLIAFGAVLPEAGQELAGDASDWARLLAATGGDLSGAPPSRFASVYLESALAHQLAEILAGALRLFVPFSANASTGLFAPSSTTAAKRLFVPSAQTPRKGLPQDERCHSPLDRLSANGDSELDVALARLLAGPAAFDGSGAGPHTVRPEPVEGRAGPICRPARPRVVRHAPLDVHFDDALRCVQVVTSLQRGGAERIALALCEELPRRGVRSVLAAISRPTRLAYRMPTDAIEIDRGGLGRPERLEALAKAAIRLGADLLHAHLLDAEDMTVLAGSGVPLVVTVHNARPGWPAGLDRLAPGTAALLVACSREVEEQLLAAGVSAPVRTVWNGIDFQDLERTPTRRAAAAQLREQLGFSAEDLVLLALANPRPQKRLERLPAVLAATRDALAQRGSSREVRLVLVGENSALAEPARRCLDAFRAEVERLGLTRHVREAGAVEDVNVWLAAADVLLSASAYEGLSLAQLEAVAAGLWVVATTSGGTLALARDNPAVSVAPSEAGAEELAARVVDRSATGPPAACRTEAARHFSREITAARYARLYGAALRSRRRGEGLLLVTNNFSTGGAQSSARRLLLGLASAGRRIRAAVLEEQLEHPTPGRQALIDAGIEVMALPSSRMEPGDAVDCLLAQIDRDPPETVAFWNALASHKLLLADALPDIHVYDVSPGEMYYDSLERSIARRQPGLPCLDAFEYGSRLAGVVVKYAAEAPMAARTLGASVHVIPNGVPLEPWPRPRRSASDAGERLVLGTAARIAPHKRLEELLEAFRIAQPKLPAHVLRIAGRVERGAESYASRLRRLSAGLDVEWVGELLDTRSLLEDLDVFVLVAEPAGCPNASLEAMARGLPVVATDVGGMSEQVVDGVTGRLTPRADIEALAEAIIDACGDLRRLERWGAASRLRAETHFDVHRMVADYSRIFFPEG